MPAPLIPDSAQRIVASLASDAKVSVDEVAQLYEDKRAELDREARIKSFLPIFAIRGVQDALRRSRVVRASEKQPPEPSGGGVGREATA